jgi:hypothetical protein
MWFAFFQKCIPRSQIRVKESSHNGSPNGHPKGRKVHHSHPKKYGKMDPKYLRKNREKKCGKNRHKKKSTNAFQKIENTRSKRLTKCVPKSLKNAFQKVDKMRSKKNWPKKYCGPHVLPRVHSASSWTPKCIPKNWKSAFQKVDKMRFKKLKKCYPKSWPNAFQKIEKMGFKRMKNVLQKIQKTWGDTAVHLCIFRPSFRSHCCWASHCVRCNHDTWQALRPIRYAALNTALTSPHPTSGGSAPARPATATKILW